jgi:hypothetical protein
VLLHKPTYTWREEFIIVTKKRTTNSDIIEERSGVMRDVSKENFVDDAFENGHRVYPSLRQSRLSDEPKGHEKHSLISTLGGKKKLVIPGIKIQRRYNRVIGKVFGEIVDRKRHTNITNHHFVEGLSIIDKLLVTGDLLGDEEVSAAVGSLRIFE